MNMAQIPIRLPTAPDGVLIEPTIRRRALLGAGGRGDQFRGVATAGLCHSRTGVGCVRHPAVAGADHLCESHRADHLLDRHLGTDRCEDREQPECLADCTPIVQILASFPANFVFPFAVYAFIDTGISLDFGGILLMALGAQWYILFNVIAGAQAIPSDLKEAMDDFGVHGWQRWKRLNLPAVFASFITGAITASGGAWNASIVAEIVTYGGTTLTATGLGAYIAQAIQIGDFHRILAGVAVMSLYIVSVNRLVWRRLYGVAERRFS